jgi:hypothetical protein
MLTKLLALHWHKGKSRRSRNTLFGAMKEHFAGHRFDTVDEVFQAAESFVNGLSGMSYKRSFLNGYDDCSYVVKAAKTMLRKYCTMALLVL